MWINPVSYGVSGIRHGLYGLQDAPAVLATPGICLLVTAAFAALMIGFAAYTVRQPLFKA
jgi:ABC-2 type transport system permease protein